MRTKVIALVASMVLVCGSAPAKKRKPKGKSNTNKTKIIDKKDFLKGVEKLLEDERVPVASSTLVEKGRSEDFYGVMNLLDDNPETFWAEGEKGWGKKAWLMFHLPDASTHIEITPGAGKEQFTNFNRPRLVFIDYYFVKEKKKQDGERKIEFKWLGRSKVRFKDKPAAVRVKIPVKLSQLVMAERTMYVGVMLFRKVYRGQFDDTAISSLRVQQLWGEE